MAVEIHKTAINTPEIQSAGPNTKLKGFLLSNGKVYLGSQKVGTGAAQNIAHGLGAVPAGVIAIPTDAGTVTYGTHTSTNVVITGTLNGHFDILAWL